MRYLPTRASDKLKARMVCERTPAASSGEFENNGATLIKGQNSSKEKLASGLQKQAVSEKGRILGGKKQLD